MRGTYIGIGFLSIAALWGGGCPTSQQSTSALSSTGCGESGGVEDFGCYDQFAHEPVNLACFLPTSRWPRIDLTWRLVTPLPGLDVDVQLAVVRDVFAAWDAASVLSFTEVQDAADISIGFVESEHGDPYPFDGVGTEESNVLGHAFFPGFGGYPEFEPSPGPGDVHLCAEEPWATSPGVDRIDLFTVLLHEVGHALGLAHSANETSLMYPRYPDAGFTGLPQADIDAMVALYGSDDGIPPVADFADEGLCSPANYTNAENDPDTDHDGLPDSVEVFVLGTDWRRADSDGDGFSDGDEVLENRTSPLIPYNENTPDADADGLRDDFEIELGTSPQAADTDLDGLTDGEEVFLGTNPLVPDSDGDGVNDGLDAHPNNSAFSRLRCAGDEDCTDNQFCNGVEACTDLRCVSGTLPCGPTGGCDEELDRCQPPPRPLCSVSADCSDGRFCNGNEVCLDGECFDGPNPCSGGRRCNEANNRCDPLTCDDENPCTDDALNPATGECEYIENRRDCDDGNACSSVDVCDDGECVGVQFLSCNDENLCTEDRCDPATGCEHPPLCCPAGTFCSANGACCGALACFGTAFPCPP